MEDPEQEYFVQGVHDRLISEIALSPEAESRLASTHRVDAEAYEAYLKERFHTYKFTPQNLETAMGYFQRALEIDPDYAPA